MGCTDDLRNLWREAIEQEVRAMVQEGWEAQQDGFRPSVVRALGTPRGFRDPCALTWTRAQGTVSRAIQVCDRGRLAKALFICFTSSHRPLCANFYRLLGLSNATDTDEDVLERTDVPPTDTQYSKAFESALPEDRVRFILFVATVADRGIQEWQAGARRLFVETILPYIRATVQSATALESLRSGQADTAASVIETKGDGETEDHCEPDFESYEDEDFLPPPPARHPRVLLSPLDHAMIDLIVQSVAAQHGVPSPDIVRLITDELVHLNSKRVQSRFHLGLLAALSDEELPARKGDENDQRRAWLLAGWLMGHHRRDPNSSVTKFDDLSLVDRESLRSVPDAFQDLADAITVHCVTHTVLAQRWSDWVDHAGYIGITAVVRHGYEMLAAKDLAGALLVTDRVTKRCAALVSSGDVSEVAKLLPMVTLLRARALRLGGRFEQAKLALEDPRTVSMSHSSTSRTEKGSTVSMPSVLGGAQSPEFAPMYLEYALCELRTINVTDLWIPDRSTNQTTLQRLVQVAPALQQTLAAKPLLEAAYLLALACLLGGDGKCSETFAALLPQLSDARSAPCATLTAEDEQVVRQRLEVLLTLLGTDDPSVLPTNAVATVADYENKFGLIPFYAVRPLLERALLEPTQEAGRLALPRLSESLMELERAGFVSICFDNPQLVQKLVDERATFGDALGGRQRIELMSQLFSAAVRQPLPRDVLIELADELIMRVNEFTDGAACALDAMLANEGWQRVWDQTAFTAVRVGLARWCSEDRRLMERSHLMQRARALAESNPDESLELLDCCEILGESSESTIETRALVERLARAVKPKTTPSEVMSRRVRVLFVGGDERQKACQESVVERVLASRPNTKLEFVYPGWSANWGARLTNTIHQLEGFDVVVLQRYMRTLFGEGLRKAINDRKKQWRPVYGHAAPSIARAIVTAANDVAAVA